MDKVQSNSINSKNYKSSTLPQHHGTMKNIQINKYKYPLLAIAIRLGKKHKIHFNSEVKG